MLKHESACNVCSGSQNNNNNQCAESCTSHVTCMLHSKHKSYEGDEFVKAPIATEALKD